ncbi:50S ribosome-binding GTPase [Pasteurella atlantica]|uniref:GTPase family protein n=1 Tax=Pasteurellaceae TaxID=712 RepID=UPI0027680F4A|nr:GTPase [Pasteurella atlantica]MDP8034359.1 50S ribosome-binding GTPase [Pasteurella atlantica]MDP8036256.1 50S ribosome-binding GTPase [Pasteurella atlantica]MDP8038242.1 50S ribosome-binding GTPase [Pasteurella atlantica]MDP8048561.1 50S ribosome-binding GTPase [Pasteurella atlantica]MDP8050553.1 50S ribosome-binding GTPase [Pasteurella atlantica]
MSQLNKSQINETLDKLLESLPSEFQEAIKSKLEETIYYTPTIGIMGKSGAGKSSLINSIVGQKICETSGAAGCTREDKEIIVPVGNRELKFVDFPGVAENNHRNSEYTQMYADRLKDLDIILWVIKVDDRANVNDEQFYNWLTKYYKKEQILFVLSQVDKAEPSRGWNYDAYQPSEQQLKIIDENKRRIEIDFDVSPNLVIPVACDYYENKFDRYNIETLISRIIKQVPKEAKSSLLSSIDKKNVSTEAKKDAKSGFRSVVEDIIDVVIDYIPVPTPVKTVARAAKEWVAEKAEAVWDWFFG